MPAAPSLLIVPYRSKTGKLYSQIPTSGAGDFTVTRNTEARRFNSAGLIASVASGIPRLDYYTSGGTAGCPALLVEPAATNLAPNANLMNQFDTPTVSGGVTFTTGSTDFLAPDGTSGSINKYVGGVASNQSTRYLASALQASVSGVHNFSLFVKRGATNPLDFCALQFALFTGASGTTNSYFSLASGTALTSGASIQDYGNGWYRLTTAPITLASADLSGTISFTLAEGDNDVTWPVSGALNLTAYTWGAQFEAGSIATSYIPTTAGTGSRSADVISVSGAVSGSIGQTEGTIYAEAVYSSIASTKTLVAINDGTVNNRIALRIVSTTSISATVVVAGTSYTISATIPAIPSSGVVKMALGYKADDYALAINGTIYPFTTTRPVPPTTAVFLGNNGFGADFLNDRILAATLYTTRLTDAELATLTTP